MQDQEKLNRSRSIRCFADRPICSSMAVTLARREVDITFDFIKSRNHA